MSKATELADKLEEDPSMWGGLSKVAWPAAGELRRLDAENARMRKGAERVPGKMPLFEQHQGANYGESHEEGYINGWNACVDAMLAAAPQPASAQPVAQPEPDYTSLSVPMGRIAERKLDSLIVDGYHVCGVMIERPNEDATQVKRAAVSVGGLVLWWRPVQPVAYPVAQPERVVQGEPVAARVVRRVIPEGHGTPERITYDVEWAGVDPRKWSGDLYTRPQPERVALSDADRTAFEKAARAEGCTSFIRVGDGYADRRTLRCWRIWQAAHGIKGGKE